MLGQAYSPVGRKYNVIILAGGAGSRMGNASDYIPKALSKIGHQRAIDYMIDKYAGVAGKFIIGTGYHSDLLESYLKGKYSSLPMCFSREGVEQVKNNARSTTLCLDAADSRLGTIIVFCDLIMLNNNCLPCKNDKALNGIYLATSETNGNIGNFRHSINLEYKENSCPGFVEKHDGLQDIDEIPNGILGTFVCDDTPLLKRFAYGCWDIANDLTEDILLPYWLAQEPSDTLPIYVARVYEFGNENDLRKVRELWEKSK
jgi:bifunctional N-acetylglucosamine-1-phosphate-uridyltransferase/glucosamine-1-phosphate-acetyltransferase GlmU-like protein